LSGERPRDDRRHAAPGRRDGQHARVLLRRGLQPRPPADADADADRGALRRVPGAHALRERLASKSRWRASERASARDAAITLELGRGKGQARASLPTPAADARAVARVTANSLGTEGGERPGGVLPPFFWGAPPPRPPSWPMTGERLRLPPAR